MSNFRLNDSLMAFVFLPLLLSVPAFGDISYRTVVFTGQSAPGTAVGTTFSNAIGGGTLDDQGRATFHANASGPAFSDRFGFWSETSGTLSLLAFQGLQAPGTPSGQFWSGFPAFSARGQGAALMSLIGGPGVTPANNLGIWSNRSGSMDLVARAGSAAPGTGAGVNFAASDVGQVYGFSAAPVNKFGRTAFSAVVTGAGVSSSNNTGIWSDISGSLSLHAQEGSPAPGTPGGVSFGDFMSTSPKISDSNQIAFLSFLRGPGITFDNNVGIWSNATGQLALVARAGSVAPGTSANFASNLNHPRINSAGQVAFIGGLSGGGVDSSNNWGAWSGGPGSLELIARSGDSAPGTLPGVTFSSVGNNLVLSQTGKTSFIGALAGTGVNGANNTGIWSNASGSLSLLVREGSVAPGTELGVSFSDFSFLTTNAFGQIAFKAHITGPGVNSGTNNDEGIWATDRDGNLHLIAREKQLFEVNPGVFGIIQDTGLGLVGGSGWDLPVSFNDNGQLIFNATFNGLGQGVFVANVPEPTPITAFLGIGFLFVTRRR